MKLNSLAATAAIAASLVSFAGVASANEFIVNGSFEAMPFTGGQLLGITDSNVPGWHIPASDGIYPWGLQNANPYSAGPADSGNQWIVLGEVGRSVDYTIQQTMTGLTPGQTYHLTFAIASEQLATTGSVAEVSFLSGSSTGAQDFTAPPRGTTYWNPWGHESMNFVATGSSVTLQFKDLAIEFPAAYDLGLDSVSVTGLAGGVPEPATWAMMLVGFCGLGVAMRGARRKRPSPVLAG